ncbi:hypothetical protein EEI45_05930 [Erysipelothrix piscisicarius]|uniref:YhgE/Pip domain-containing protein n=1 Tax=Erysipelothrix piscisicarius TaxID=2485784 RepID=A0A3S8RNG4_9FIRM|nr:hypothetical protein [Erysipelothrix piscisicarius]AZK44343.1 hypothetical protein EEI45_05930 [Erysipelothrix piscisicarius]
MKTKNSIRALSGAIAIIMVAVIPVSADEPIKKDETVFVNLDSDGRVLHKVSSVHLHSDKALKTVTDQSNLKNIVNVKTDDQPGIAGNTVLWNTDQKDVYYQGDLEQALPIETTIHYTLDGKTVRPEEILGQSGRLKILIDIKNNDPRTIKLKNGGTKNGYAPYLVATVMNLSSDVFKDVTVNTGKLIQDGNNQIATFAVLPGMKENLGITKDLFGLDNHIEVQANVVDFEMSPIVFTATSNIPDLDALEHFDRVDDIARSIDTLKDAANQLADGTQQLSEGSNQLNSSITDYVNAVGKINDGSHELSSGAGVFFDGIYRSSVGAQSLADNTSLFGEKAAQLSHGYMALSEGVTQYASKATQLSDGFVKASEALKPVKDSVSKLNSGMAQIDAGTQQLTEGTDQVVTGVTGVQGANTMGLNQINQSTQTIASLKDQISVLEKAIALIPEEKDRTEIQQEYEALVKTVHALEQSNAAVNSIYGQIDSQLPKLVEGSEAVKQGLETVNTNQKAVLTGLGQLDNGLEQFENVSMLLNENAKKLNEGAMVLDAKSKEAFEGSKLLLEGSSKLASGATELSNGMNQLNDGSSSVKEGLDALASGTTQAYVAGSQLESGSSKLAEGSMELNNKVSEGLAEAKSHDEISLDDLTRVLDVKDGLIEIAESNTTISGLGSDMEGSSKMIMRTEAIKKEKETKVIEETVKEHKGFFAWVKEKIGK